MFAIPAASKSVPCSGGRGFTLIELMVTVAVVGILAAVAYPSYLSYVVRGNRSQGQQFLMDLAQRQERLRLDQGSYTSDASVLGADSPPEAVSRYYSGPSLYVPAGGPSAFVAALTPKSGTTQADDGRLFVNSAGASWRDVSSSCALKDCSPNDSTAMAWK